MCSKRCLSIVLGPMLSSGKILGKSCYKSCDSPHVPYFIGTFCKIKKNWISFQDLTNRLNLQAEKYLFRRMKCNDIDYITFTNVTKMHATLLNSKVSKNIRNQGKTLFCWAFAISTMLRQSLNLFLSKLDGKLPN